MSDDNQELGGDGEHPPDTDGATGGAGVGDDGGTTLPDLDWTGDGLTEEAPAAVGGVARRRLGGMVALLLGVIGVLLALVLAFTSLQMLFGASGRVDDSVEPVRSAFDRLEERIDQADDLIDERGIDADVVPELQARVDGLVDVATAAESSFEAVDEHPIYGLLPADLSGLGDHLDRFQASAEAIDESLGSSTTVRTNAAAAMSDEIDGMQGRVTAARQTIDDASSSLRTWLRIAGFIGFLIALWMLWSQLVFVRRGWRGFRARDL